MTVSYGRIPHALASTYQYLAAMLGEGNAEFIAGRQHASKNNVFFLIVAFVDALYQIRGGRKELHRRATFVEKRCGPRSAYTAARKRSLRSYLGQPRKVTGSKLALDSLMESDDAPLFLSDVSTTRRDIEMILDGEILNLSDAARQTYGRWASACLDVRRKAEVLEVDGCWHLFNIHQASEDNPTDRAKLAKEIIQSDIGGANLESIRAAADSLVVWAEDSHRHDESAPKSAEAEKNSNKQMTRKPHSRLTSTDVNDDRRIAEAWHTRRYKTLEELAVALKKKTIDVKRAIDRNRKRNSGRKKRNSK